MAMPDYRSTHPKTREAWRQWLQKNHASSPGIWLIYYKTDSGKRKLSYAEAVEEALCFGWIDSLPRKLDEQRAMLKFTPRKPKSAWSQLNKTRIKRLIEEGADIDKRCIDFQATPLFWAVMSYKEENDKYNQLECVKLLVEAGADKNIPNGNSKTIYSMINDEDLELKK